MKVHCLSGNLNCAARVLIAHEQFSLNMLGYQDLEEACGSSVTFGSSPPNRPFVADGSDLFKSVMQDFKQENRLSKAVVDKVMVRKQESMVKADACTKHQNYLCRRCLSNDTLCRCFQNHSKNVTHRVQWIDELCDKPLAMEQSFKETYEFSSPPITPRRDSVKPILKHKANCIIIISE